VSCGLLLAAGAFGGETAGGAAGAGDRSDEPAAPPREVSFETPDGGMAHGDLYGAGPGAVVLVHGGRFDRKSWSGQAPVLAAGGFQVLAIDCRGKGRSRGGPGAAGDEWDLDVLGAVRFLRGRGSEEVSVVGASLGGWAAGQASTRAEPGEIDRLVLLAHSPIDQPERMQGRKLFILARDDPDARGRPRLERIREQFEQAPEPKELVLLEGSAHAQHIFETDQGERLLSEIVRFLTEP
jgi:pimeloyl-ACP methyl ester carboxylesterase